MGSLSVFRVALHQTSHLEQHDGADGIPSGGADRKAEGNPRADVAQRGHDLFTPAGLENGIREMGEPARSLTVPPQPEEPPDEAEMERLAAIGARYGAEILGPPPGQ
jgi:hypothetical protein